MSPSRPPSEQFDPPVSEPGQPDRGFDAETESDPYNSPWPAAPAAPPTASPAPSLAAPQHKQPRDETEFTRTARIRRTGIKRASAGRVIGVGLLCFGLWTLFDANQLYQNALSSPFGTRRSVALSVLRPLKDVTNALRISGPVNAADSALGRGGEETISTLPPLPPTGTRPARRPPNDADQNGIAPRPHTNLGQRGAGGPTPPPPPPPAGPPPLRQPSRAHPLVMLDIGDSIGEDLGFGLGDVFAHDPYVKVIQKGMVDTGLAHPFGTAGYNWPVELETFIHQYHPGVVVMMMGANDDQTLALANGSGIPTTSPQWDAVYRHRMLLLMAEATASGAHVIWVGLPPVQNSAVNPAFARHVNSIAQSLAQTTPGVTYVSSWSLLAGPQGQFVQYKDVDGTDQQIRYSDGVHLAPAGWDLLASYLLQPMRQSLHIRLHAKALMTLTTPKPSTTTTTTKRSARSGHRR